MVFTILQPSFVDIIYPIFGIVVYGFKIIVQTLHLCLMMSTFLTLIAKHLICQRHKWLWETRNESRNSDSMAVR